MESVVAWAGEDGRKIDPYGLDLIPSLAALAQERLPRWADRISVGNVMYWKPPRRFDFVRTELEYVPRDRRRELVERLLGWHLAPGGLLILCSYGSSRPHRPRAEPVGEVLRAWGYAVVGESEGVDTNGVVIARVAWTGAPHHPKPGT